MNNFSKAVKIRVVGVVQGVGFRPYVYRLAKKFDLKGYVVNLGGSEVEIHIEGRSSDVDEFIDKLIKEKPPSVKISNVYVDEVDVEGYEDFVISESRSNSIVRSMIPPDIGICSFCIEEILNSRSRFYEYPWNSCVWCGPRFSMMISIPYDRINTSMKIFNMCEKCLKSYKNPEDVRRFHGQGISCSICGPKTHVYTSSGEKIDINNPIEFIAKKIIEGYITAIKGVGGFHIACLASKDDVVAELRRRKKRPYQPFALMARDIDVVKKIAIVDQKALELLTSPQRPIVILPKKESSFISPLVAPDLSTLGVMLPYTGFQVLLLDKIPEGVLVMTSGNIHGKPMCRDLDCVLNELKNVVDYVVDHEREIIHRVDDSVIRFTDGEPVFIRRSRGYAPEWIELAIELNNEIVAVGADLQTAGAIGFENKVVLTQFIGDLDDFDALKDLENEILWFINNYKIKPKIVVVDMHPFYHSKRVGKNIANQFNAFLIEVQHHHSHIVSVLGEHGITPDENIVGIAIDGTGYGVDGSIWGGEVLITNYAWFKRIGCLKPFSLPGGDTAVLYPVKSLISLMVSAGLSYEEIENILTRFDLIKTLPHGYKEFELTYLMAKNGKSVTTTSMGRTLDAFASLLKICTKTTYEGEPPIKLEALADRKGVYLDYEPGFSLHNELYTVDTQNLLLWVLENIDKRKEDLAITILKSLGRSLGRIALKILKGLRNTKQVIAIGGGAAVNTYIVRGIKEIAREEDVKIILPKHVPPNDGGIALGQIIIASHKVKLDEREK